MTLPVGQLSPSPRLLLGPGPSDAHPRVLSVMATPLLGHLDPQFLEIMGETQELLRYAFKTKNKLTFPVSATGMAGMECCLVNLIEPGDKLVVGSIGFFGQRMVEVGERTGAQMTVIEAPWGEVFDLNRVRETLKQGEPVHPGSNEFAQHDRVLDRLRRGQSRIPDVGHVDRAAVCARRRELCPP